MFIHPNWPVPTNIKACTTLRSGGMSLTPYDSFNLADHVGDTPAVVEKNRALLIKELHLSQQPIWINQVHSDTVIEATEENRNQTADASYTTEPEKACVILTADCLPILVCDSSGTQVAAIHAGWRGLAQGIIEATLRHFPNPSELLVWLGPAISGINYEVGNEVRDVFVKKHPDFAAIFNPTPNDRWLADLYKIARFILLKQGVSNIYGGNFCTFADSKRFYSYRRDGAKTGRMASLIWISSP